MKKLSISLFILVLSFPLAAYCQQSPVSVMSPVPPWPQNGDITGYPSGAYVFLDTVTGEYVASYADPQTGIPTTGRFGSHSQVQPVVLPHVERQNDATYSYTYSLQNGIGAKTPIEKWTLLVPIGDSNLKATHPVWSATWDDTGDPRGLTINTLRLVS